MRFRHILCIASLIVLVSGCVATKLERKKVQPLLSLPEESSSVSYAAAPPVTITIKEEEPEPFPTGLADRKFSIRLRDADIKETLLTMAAQTGMNIVFGEDIKGTVSLILNKVPLEQALKALMKSIGRTYTIENGIIHIKKFERRTFIINYVYGELSTSSTSSGSGSGSSGGTSTGRTGSGSSSGSGSSNDTDIWQELEDTLETLKSSDGSITVDKYSGMIIVEDYPEHQKTIEHFLERYQQIANRQVLIDAKLFEISLNEEFQMGVDWDVPRLGLGFLHQSTAGSASAQLTTGGVAQFVISSDHVTALIDLLNEQGQLNVISSPRMTTINNQPAFISISEQIPYYTGQISSETGNILSWTVNFKQAGLQFELIPQIGEDGNLVIKVNHSISELVGYTDPVRAEAVPIVDVREARTTVRVGTGETVIIGGLMREKISEQLSMVPGLGHLPWLGSLFRKTVQIKKKTELVLLLTPRIIYSPEALREFTRNATDSVQDNDKGLHFGTLHPMLEEK